MCRKCTLISIILVLSLLLVSANAETAVDWVINARTAQAFTDEAVPEEDLRVILEAGLAATSAINQQPWHFVAITNREVMDEIMGSMGGFGGILMDSAPDGAADGDRPTLPDGEKPDGAPAGDMPAPPAGGMTGGAKSGLGDSPVAVVIYMDEGSKSPNASFDCGLACENMFIAAKSLGYGAKIISSPTMQLNGNDHDALCEKLGVDKSYTAVAVLLIGREDESVDGTSGTSVRSAMDEKVSFVD